MDKGLLIRDLAEELRVTEDTVVNWEVRGVKPGTGHIQKFLNLIPNVARFFESG